MDIWLPRQRVLNLAMVFAIAVVCLLAYLDLRREQERALDDFVAEQTALARSFAETLSSRIEAVVRDLEATAEEANAADVEPLLRRLVASDGPCREVALLNLSGEPIFELSADGTEPRISSSAMSDARGRLSTVVKPGVVAMSAPLNLGSASKERFRLFSLRGGERTMVFLVDINRLFAGMQGIVTRATGAPSHWIVLDDAHRLVEFSAPEDGGLSHSETMAIGGEREVETLLQSMGNGQEGAALLSRPAAASLDLGHRMAVAGFAPVHTGTGRDWSVAVVASAMRVRDRARLATLRLGAATGVASLLVALFSIVVSRQQQREQRLSEALHLAETTSALRERSEKMIDVIPIGVLALDSGLRVTSVNPYLLARNVAPEGRLFEALPHATAAEIATLEALLFEARASRRPIERSGLLLHLSTETPRDIDVFAIPLDRPFPGVDCFLVLNDRTEVKVLERNLVRAEKLATIGTLAAGVAHEVGTPLGIISGRAEQLLSRVSQGPESAAIRKNVASILSQVDKVSTTIRQLLDFARVRPIVVEPVALSHALENVCALLEHRFRQAKVTFSVDASVKVAVVAADPGQLEQVLVNLLMNACDACLSGGQIRVRAAQQGDTVVFEVSDDGAGILPEHLPLVLDPFFTTKKRGQGTGLGLTIAADIVKNHGGTLELDSTVGQGTTARIRLPKAKGNLHDNDGASS